MALTKNFLIGVAVAAPLIAAVGAVAPVQAASLGSYTFPSAGDNSPSGVDPNLTLSDFTRGSGLLGGTFLGGTGAIRWTTDVSPDPNDFFSFTATVASGYQLSLNTLALQLYRVGLPVVGSGAPRNWEVGASVNGGAITSLDSGALTGVNTANNINVNLASLGTVTSPVQFFIYGFRANNGAGILGADNVQLDGTVNSVPTPAMLPAMIGFGVGILRKRKSAKLAEV
jgi:hypothetical protein